MIGSGLALLVLASVASAAGWGIARRLLGVTVREGDRVVVGLAAGLTVAALAVHAPGHRAGVAILCLLTGAALLGRAGWGEWTRSLRACSHRLVGWTLGAAVLIVLFHASQFAFASESRDAEWRGTLGWEGLLHASIADAVIRGDAEWPVAGFDGPIRHHTFTHAITALTAWIHRTVAGGGDDATLIAQFRTAPALWFVLAFEAHRFFLRAWFPPGRAVSVAAVVPVLVNDFDGVLRLAGLPTADAISNRAAHSMIVSPSFIAGQAVVCVVLGIAVRAMRGGGSGPSAAGVNAAVRGGAGPLVVAGLLAGSCAGWKLPSAVFAAVALAGLAPPILRAAPPSGAAARGHPVAALACLFGSFAFAALVSYAATFGLAGGAPAGGFAISAPEWMTGAGPATAAALLAAWTIQTAGPRLALLFPRVRRDVPQVPWACILLPLAAGLVLPLLLSIGPGHEERYLARCGGALALLVATAWAFHETRSAAQWGTIALLAACSAVQIRRAFEHGSAEGSFSGSELAALRTAAEERTLRVGGDVPERVVHAISAWTGRPIRNAPPDVRPAAWILAGAAPPPYAGSTRVAGGRTISVWR